MDTQTCTDRDSVRSALTSPEFYSGGDAPHEQKPGGNIQDVVEPEHSKQEERQAEQPGGVIQAPWRRTLRADEVPAAHPLSARAVPCTVSRSTHQRGTPNSWAAGPAINNTFKALVTTAVCCGGDGMRKTAGSMMSWPKNKVKPYDELPSVGLRSTFQRGTPGSGAAGPAVNNVRGVTADCSGGNIQDSDSWLRKNPGDESKSRHYQQPGPVSKMALPVGPKKITKKDGEVAYCFPGGVRSAGIASIAKIGKRWYILFQYESRPLKGGVFKNELSLPGGKAEADDATPVHTGVREQGEETGGVVASCLSDLQGPTILAGHYAVFEDRCELAVINQAPAKYAAKYKGKTSYEIDPHQLDYKRLTKHIIVDEMVFNGAGWGLVGDHYDDCGVKLEPGWAFQAFLEAFRPHDLDTLPADLAPPSVRAPRADVSQPRSGSRSAPPLGRTQAGANPFAELEFLEDN
ncbi:hypothetical protein FOA52_010417 [Chlamydomonas sp. UWO 241]|nr:hypothetical protein FOA52_010417 [Chlamydomonas sp. UWO 241]